MAYLRELSARAAAIQRGVAYGNIWPTWEVQSPQYPMPNPYNLAQVGYRKDELVYSCIDYRAQTVSEPLAMICKGKGKDKEPTSGLFDSFPHHQVNSEMGEAEFWMVSEIYRLIAGNAIWEIETNRLGAPVNLWPLNPSYCSFMRGETRPLNKVRYLYPGLNPVDIPREKLVIFQEFDPIYPLLKGMSRTAVAMRSIGVHSSTSDFLNIFFQRGANIQGYLKFAQSLNDVEADRARKRWRDTHGGVGNWGENNISVLGQGADYVPTQMNMKDMAFAEIDGRTESLICMVFGISPILLGAKVGLQAATLANYEQAEDHFYNRVMRPSWRWYAGEMTQQLLPLLDDSEDLYVDFDTSTVSALSIDEDALWKRVLEGAHQNVIYRDEARSMLNLDPVDGDVQVFLGVTLRGPDAPAETARIADPNWIKEEQVQPQLATMPQPSATNFTTAGAVGPATTTTAAAQVKMSTFTTITTNAPTFGEPTTTKQYQAWRDAALSNIGPVGAPFDAELEHATSKSQVRAIFEAHWPTRQKELDPVQVLNEYVQLEKARLAERKQ